MKQSSPLRNSRIYLTALLGLGSALPTWAQEVRTKDWVFREAKSEVLGNYCVAVTEKKQGQENFSLSLVVSKDKTFAPFLTIGRQKADEMIAANLQSNGSQTLFRVLRDGELDAALSDSRYYLPPMKMATLVERLRQDSNAKLTFKTGTSTAVTSVVFSLSGSMKTIDILGENCGVLKEAAPAAFFNFLDSTQALETGSGGIKGTLAMRSEVSRAYTQYLESGVQSQSIKNVQKQMDPLLKQQQDYLARSGQLTDGIRNRIAQKDSLLAQNEKLQRDRVQLQFDEKQKEEELLAGLADLSVKTEAFRPLREQIKPLEQEQNRAEDYLDRAQNDLNTTQGQIRSEESNLSQMRSDLSQLESNLWSEQRAVEHARAEVWDAERDYRNFDFQRELDYRLRNDYRLRDLARRLEEAQRDLREAKQVERAAELRKQQAKAALEQCRATNPSVVIEVASIELLENNRPGRPGRPDKPERPDRPNPPTPPTNPPTPPTPPVTPPPPPPAKDCSREEAAFQAARSEHKKAEDKVEKAGSAVAWTNRAYGERHNEIRNEVSRIQDNLANRVANARIDLNRAIDRLRNTENAIANLRSDIPRSQDRIDRLRSSLPALNREIANAEAQLNRANAELASFKARTNYDVIAAAFYNADNLVNQLKSQLNSIQTRIQLVEGTLVINAKKISTLQSEIEAFLAEAARNDSNLAAVEAQLEPLKAQKQNHETLLAQAQGQMLISAKMYKAILNETINGSSILINKSLTSFGSKSEVKDFMKSGGEQGKRAKDVQLETTSEAFYDWM